MQNKNKDKTSILVTGSGGLIGSKFADQYADKYIIEPIDISNRDNPIDITKVDQVISAFEKSPANFVIHFAAYTDVTGAWEQRDDETGIAYQVNVVGTENIVKACRETNNKLIHISTAYVFDGEKSGAYLETDKPNPIEWYGQTKFLAEEVVKTSDIDWTIFRIDQPFRSDKFARADLVARVIEKLREDNLPPMFINHYFGPTYIDDFCKVLDWAIRTSPTGLYHATSGESWTDFDFATLVKTTHNLQGEVRRGDLNEYLQNTTRPYQKNTVLNSNKLKSELDFELKTIKEAVAEVEA